LGDSGIVTLATALSHAKPSLVTLDLSNNAMGVDGSRAIARCLPDLASLETLVVHGTSADATPRAGALRIPLGVPPRVCQARSALHFSERRDRECKGKYGAHAACPRAREAAILTLDSGWLPSTSLTTFHRLSCSSANSRAELPCLTRGVNSQFRGMWESTVCTLRPESLRSRTSQYTVAELVLCSLRFTQPTDLGECGGVCACTDNLIGIESAKSLAESISGIKTLEWVTVTEQLALPVGALKRNDLTTLDLGRQKMGSADAIILASLLRKNTSLEVLELACMRPLPRTLTSPLHPPWSTSGGWRLARFTFCQADRAR
jgi:hypothetical protein